MLKVRDAMTNYAIQSEVIRSDALGEVSGRVAVRPNGDAKGPNEEVRNFRFNLMRFSVSERLRAMAQERPKGLAIHLRPVLSTGIFTSSI